MIHAFQEEDGWYIWLDPDIGQARTGLCIGTGRTLAKARSDAIQYLGESLKQLSRPLKDMAQEGKGVDS